MTSKRFAHIEGVEETGSTNDDLLEIARHDGDEQVLVAERQTAGRGRLDRRWEAPAGVSLLCSILVRPQVSAGAVHIIPWAVALAAADAAAQVCKVDLALKWPNDLVAVGGAEGGGDAKVAGLLSELVLSGGSVDAVVVGIGVNVNWAGRFPSELAASSASLDGLCGHEVDRVALLAALIDAFDEWLTIAEQADGTRVLRDHVVARSATLGRQVRVELADRQLVGTASELLESGALVVTGPEGDRTEVTVGDVVHLRPVDRAQP